MQREHREAAKRQREVAVEKFGNGEIGLRELFTISTTREFRALRTIPVWQLLAAQSGWNRKRAQGALSRYGFGVKDRVLDIREGAPLDRLEGLLSLNTDRWDPRPALPEGYPFRTKAHVVLEVLLAEGMPLSKILGKGEAPPEVPDSVKRELIDARGGTPVGMDGPLFDKDGNLAEDGDDVDDLFADDEDVTAEEDLSELFD